MKADAEAHAKQLQSIVEQLMTKQGQTSNTANGIWSILSSGNLKVDAATQFRLRKILQKTVTGVLNRHLTESSILQMH